MARKPIKRDNNKDIKKKLDKASGFPSRDLRGLQKEWEAFDQLNIRLPADQAVRFKIMAKKDRWPHGEFLKILMDHYEG